MIVGTAGHIDHGKTALVRALTGVDTDRLKEEKARGITIDLGFAYADLGAGVTGFVDVPGHERFVHTMVAGAGGIDMALLVIAADDGIMPQTREHLAILDLLGIRRGIVALSKCDMAEEPLLAARREEITALLAPTGLAGAQTIAVSALTGSGLEELRHALILAEAETQMRAAEGRFRMTVDRSFTLTGAGTVVTGTVLSGRVAPGDTVTISPAGLSGRVRGVHAQNRAAAEGRAGQRCAVNIAGDGISREAIHRGDMLLAPALHAPTQRIDARLHVLGEEPKPLGTWFPARFHSGAAEADARIVPLDGPLRPGESGLCQIVLDRPVAATVGDSFILRDVSARRTIGGGRLLDLRAPQRRRSTAERLALIRAAEAADPLAAMLLTEPGFVAAEAFFRDRALLPAETEAVTIGSGETRVLMRPERREALAAGLIATLDAWHEDNPEAQGLGRERLRLALPVRLPKEPFLAFLRAEAEAGRIVQDGAFLRLPGHEIRLDPADADLLERCLPELSGPARFRPPRVRDLAAQFGLDEREVRRVLKLGQKTGRVDQVAHDHFFTRETVAEMVAIARDVGAASPEGFTAAAFRDRMDNGRKVAIQILDFLDRHGVTLRRGDLRRINPHRLDLFGPLPDRVPDRVSDRVTDGLPDTPPQAPERGGASSPVGRPDFNSGWGSEPVPGGFDSHSPPPSART